MSVVAKLKEKKLRVRWHLDARLIKSSHLYDEKWYLEHNPDVAEFKIDPALHYLVRGGFEGRDPGPNFLSLWYLDTNEDVKRAGLNPLLHYLKWGRKEGRASFPRIIKVQGLYEYSKQRGGIVFEDEPERIYMRAPKLMGEFSGALQEGEALCPRPYVAVVEDSIVFGGENSILMDQDVMLSDELLEYNTREFGTKTARLKHHEGHPENILLAQYTEPKEEIEEGILLSCSHDYNYFHWLVECLPKLLLLDSLDAFKDVPLLIPDGLHKNLMVALERVNVNHRPVRLVNSGVSYRVKRLIVPSALSRIVDRYDGSPVFNRDIVLSHKWLRKIRDCLRGAAFDDTQPGRRIFLTRRKGLRALGNRDEVELALLQRGFELVELEGASLDVQIELFSQVSLVMAPTGAALTNLLFCRPGTKVVIFMSNHDVTNFYFWENLADIVGVDLEIVVGQRLFNSTGYYSVHDDYEVDPDLVLERAGYKHPPMNYSRYLHYRSLVQSIIARVSPWLDTDPPAGEAQQLRQFLGSLDDIVRAEIDQVKSSQEGGYWPVTKGDKLFIRYLNQALVAVHSVLIKPSPRSEEYRVLVDRLEQLLERLQTDHHPRIKAVFFAQERFTWPSLKSVYEAFAANPACEAQLVYVDFEHANTDASRDWFAEYREMNLPMVWSEAYDVSLESPDLAFFVKPYDGIPMQFYIDELGKVVRRPVYIPYFVNWMALKNIDFLIRYHFQLPLHEKAWKIFDAPDFILESHVRHGAGNGRNVELIGHPRFDIIPKLEQIRERIPATWKAKIAGRKVVLWNTHSFIADNNWSTFGTLGDQILEYFQTNRQLLLLWRPHPHFFNSLVNGGVMTSEQVDELIARVTDSENIILDRTPDYLSAFSVADALISDASSLLVEFLLTRQPVMYTYNEANESIVHEHLLPALYKACAWENVEAFLRMLVDGRDDRLGERMSVIETFMPNAGKRVGELIMKRCIEDLTEEETQAGRVFSQNYAEGHREIA
jgi:capsular polysaccharide biosynthesis protein